MAIQVVCECGFRKEVPDQWQGMRVKCKCGRSFVISAEGSIQEPPIAEPPAPQPQVASEPPESRPEQVVPASSDNPLEISTSQRGNSVAARYHSRHSRADSRKRMVLYGGAVIALVCVGTLAVVLHDRFPTGWHKTTRADASTREKQPATSQDSTDRSATKPAPSPAKNSAPQQTGTSDAASELSDETGRLHSRIAEAIELGPDDGLLLTGLFGPVPKQLEFSEEQSTKIDELVGQLKAKEGGLISGEEPLEQWYVDGEKVGNELLAVLTDPQRAALRDLIEREQVARYRLEEYAATLRPELRIPIVAWKVEPDGTTLPVIQECRVAGSSTPQCLRTASASGAWAFAPGRTDATSSDTTSSSTVKYELWDLTTDQRVGDCSVPTPGPDDTTLVAEGGRSIVRGGKSGDGGYRVQVWSVDAAVAPKTKTIPQAQAVDTSTGYQLIDCVANRVLCVSDVAYWVWNLDSDVALEVSFPDWVPHDMPQCAMSPGGRYVAMTHRHSPIIDSKQYHFLEVGVYELETGELLGNQVLATDYRPLHVGAIAFSYNGRELALLWDVDPPEPKRLLFHLNAVAGKVMGKVGELPPAAKGYARRHGLQQRDLIWLPDNSCWVVNLQGLVEAESGAVIDIDLPKSGRTAGADQGEPVDILEAIPAGNHRLLLIILEPSAEGGAAPQLQGRFLELPEVSPFM